MDGIRFDTLTRALTRGSSRRGVLRLLASSPLASLVALADRHPAGAAALHITNGPRVVTKSASSATIRWSTSVAADSLARYGTTHTYPEQAYDATLETTHTLKLTKLSANTKYHYQVKSGNNSATTPFSTDAHVKTCPASRPTFCKNACADPGAPLSTACCVNTDNNPQHCGGCKACDKGLGCVNNSGNGGECCILVGTRCENGPVSDCCGNSELLTECMVLDPAKGCPETQKVCCITEGNLGSSGDCDCCGTAVDCFGTCIAKSCEGQCTTSCTPGSNCGGCSGLTCQPAPDQGDPNKHRCLPS